MDSLVEQLRIMLEGIPDDDAPVVLPKRWVLQLIAAADRDDQSLLGPEPIEGYTIPQVAAAMQRARSYVWSLVRAGRFPGAYRRGESEYRIPLAAIKAFIQKHRGDGPAATVEVEPVPDLREYLKRRRARKKVGPPDQPPS